MTVRVAVQMDPVDTIRVDKDSTFALALEAQRRGHVLYHYEAGDLAWRQGLLSARARPWRVEPVQERHSILGDPVDLDLSQVDVVLMRQDPPFDMAYITATHLLEHIHPKTLVVNDPASVRNAPEKLLVTQFPQLCPPTLITWDRAAIDRFRAEMGDIVIKPLYGNGGAGVFHLRQDDTNLGSLLELYARLGREPVIVQRYLPEVRQGDKRIILIEGEAVGAVNRVPAEGEARSNLHVGGRAEKSVLTERDLEICAAIGPTLKARGLIFTGIDVIGGWLTEINVTSPTGLHEINGFDGVCLQAKIWDAIEARLG